MKKTLLAIAAFALCFSCIKKKEQTSTESDNLKQDATQVNQDVKEELNQPSDSIANDVKDEVGKKDGFEGQKSQ